MLDFYNATFTKDHRTYDAIGVNWEDVTAALGHEHRGNPNDDAVLVKALLDAGAPAWVAGAEGAVDEFGWYLLGSDVAEPLLGSELEEYSGDFVVIGEEVYAVDTPEQLAAVALMLGRLDLPEQPVWRGSAPDTVKTSLVVVPHA